jgi:hypothetical protein
MSSHMRMSFCICKGDHLDCEVAYFIGCAASAPNGSTPGVLAVVHRLKHMALKEELDSYSHHSRKNSTRACDT